MIFDKRPTLATNVKNNGMWIGLVLSIYVAAYFGLVSQLTPAIGALVDSNLQDLSTRVRPTAILTVLVLLSIGCLTFYIKFIAKLRETPIQIAINVCVILLFATVLNFTPSLPSWSLITIGLIAITAKVYMLKRLISQGNVGVAASAYITRVFKNYLIMTVLLGIAFAWFDSMAESSQILLSEAITSTNHPAIDIISALPNGFEGKDILISLHQDYKKARSTASLATIVGGIVILAGIGYAIFSAAIIRKYSIENVLDEFAKFYELIDLSAPPSGPKPLGNEFQDDSQKGQPHKVPISASRIFTGIFISARSATSSIAAITAGVVYWRTVGSIDTTILLVLAMSVFFTSCFGFLFNDWVDERKDIYRSDLRPLGLGMLLPWHIVVAYSISAMLAAISASILPSTATYLVLLTIALLTIYSFINEKHSTIANIITAFCSALVFVVGMASGEFRTSIVILSAATFALIFGREIILDMKDMESDRRVGKVTIPHSLGRERTVAWVGSIFLLSSLMLLVSAFYFEHTFVGLGVMITASATLFKAFEKVKPAQTKDYGQFVFWSRISFLIATAGIAAA